MTTNNLTVAFAGNPNCGKTTIFNNITGARQHVGNYAGVTVERREGVRRFGGQELLLVDLPGTYSLTAHSLDEVVARNVIIDEKPDVIVNILDASNLERNLYLAIQLLELECPVVLALNMTDMAKSMGFTINDAALKDKLGIEVVRTVGNRNHGTEELLKTVVKVSQISKRKQLVIDYGEELEGKITEVITHLALLTQVKYPKRWLAVKLLENDQEVRASIQKVKGGSDVLALVEDAREELKKAIGDDIELLIAEKRYLLAGEICRAAVTADEELSHTFSDKIDGVLTHRIYGLPIFFGIMWLLFNFVFTVGAYPQEWLETGFTMLGDSLDEFLTDGELKSLLVDGVIGGVGTVISFLPQILLLFLGISLLEDTGYMARTAFLMDRIMRAVGLHGKSFIPLLLGFGCGVPAVMGTRTLENPRDRMVTILVAPLMSCSARLPVYTVLIAAFFSESMAGTVLFSIYFAGIALAVTMALIFRKFLFPGEMEAFVMEMPPYHLPTFRSIMTHMWERSALYIKKAGTLILAASILVWFLTNYPADVQYSKDFDEAKAQAEEVFVQEVNQSILVPLGIKNAEDNPELNQVIAEIETSTKDSDKDTLITGKLEVLKEAQPEVYTYAAKYWELSQARSAAVDELDKEQSAEKLAESYAGRFGKLIEPVIQPLGFDWKMGVGLVSAIAAKEVLVSTMGTIYSVGSEADEDSLKDALANDPAFNPVVAYALMMFTLVYSPCLAVLAVIRRETNSWKWTAFSFTYSTVLAWIIAFIVYRAGIFLGA